MRAEDSANASAGTSLLVVAGLVAMGIQILVMERAIQDDSFISFVYARNLAQGEGLVYNVGEAPVEGYTNFLWTAIIAGGMRLGLDPVALVRGLGMLCSLALLALTAALGRRLGATASFAAGAALLLATRRSFAMEAVGGLETLLFATLVLAALLTRPGLREGAPGRPRSELTPGFLHALAALTRPEGVLAFCLLELVELWRAVRAQRLADWLQRLAPRALPFLLIVGAHITWRWWTYGDLVPNTFHAKVGGGGAKLWYGLQYVFECVVFFGPVLFLLPLALAPRIRPGRLGGACLFLSGAWLLYVALVGGDFKPTSRFLLPVMPLWCALAAASAQQLGALLFGTEGSRAGRWSAGVLLILATLSAGIDLRANAAFGDRRVRNRQLEAAGRWLDSHLPVGATIAVSNAGAIPYFSNRRTIDMLGLNDAHIGRLQVSEESAGLMIGHLKGDGAYVLSRKPDVITFMRMDVLPAPATSLTDPWPSIQQAAFGTSERQLVDDPAFRRMYALRSVLLDDELGYFNYFERQRRRDARDD